MLLTSSHPWTSVFFKRSTYFYTTLSDDTDIKLQMKVDVIKTTIIFIVYYSAYYFLE